MQSGLITELLDTAKFILGFLPWILFLFLPANSWDQLCRAVAICMAISIVFSWKDLCKGFILQWVTMAFFLVCVISLYGFRWIWLAEHMGIIANGVLAGSIWLTVLIGKPFTLQYARADLPRELWHDEGMIRGCRSIAIFWGTLLFIPTAFNVFEHFYPAVLAERFNFYLSLSCIIVGVAYTSFFKHQKRKQRETK